MTKSIIIQENFFNIIQYIRTYELMNGNETNSVSVRPVNKGDGLEVYAAGAQVVDFMIHADGRGLKPQLLFEALGFKETKITAIALPVDDKKAEKRRKDLLDLIIERFNNV